MKIGTHKKTVIALWLVLIGSVCFGVYKNFTAIDIHTIHEKEIIRQELVDTNGIENFVKDFAKSYYSWSNTKEAMEQRTTAINQYITKELQNLNADTVRLDIPTSSSVNDVQIWNVTQSGENEFDVAYEVDQTIKENDQTRTATSFYEVKIHMDDNKNLVIIKNPTLTNAIGKSDYEPKVQEIGTFIDATTTQDATKFLETFFKLYPNATQQELAYYVKVNILKPINGDYLFAELINPIYTKDGDNISVSVSVKYLDNKTKATQISQYQFNLIKDKNWIIE